ncbi:hypothetical protein N1851_019292 [Merluccius polli]|uniref:Uncharacterized protein n=1 Tax=Merluccius polli TaxID=89951 RepID=A0AA47MLV7_MERPO|nr:hypothetical protein N1851_019292 [Merluccius polli]
MTGRSMGRAGQINNFNIWTAWLSVSVCPTARAMRSTVMIFLLFLSCMYLSAAQGSYGNCCLGHVDSVRTRAIRNIQSYMLQEADALVISRLDYCNSRLAGLPASANKPLQRIQNAAARLVFNLPKFSHTIVLTYKAVNGTAPTHLQALVRPHTPARTLCATTSAGRPVAPSLRTSKGRTAKSQLFFVLAPLWRNDLPADVRTAESMLLRETQDQPVQSSPGPRLASFFYYRSPSH